MRPVSHTYNSFSSFPKVIPVGELRQRRAKERMLCCCISIMNNDPLAFAGLFYPNGPQSVKKILPVVFESISECGPCRGDP